MAARFCVVWQTKANRLWSYDLVAYEELAGGALFLPGKPDPMHLPRHWAPNVWATAAVASIIWMNQASVILP